MIVTLVHELRRRGGGIGVASMCAGGGMGSATVVEVPARLTITTARSGVGAPGSSRSIDARAGRRAYRSR